MARTTELAIEPTCITMAILNVEFKAATDRLEELEQILLSEFPRYIGEDHQVDTYFKVEKGRLKLREGNIENALIHYDRQNIAGSKSSHILLYKHKANSSLKKILTRAIGIKAIVDKKRKIYFIDNVKFHFDTVVGLGTFVEVEAIDEKGKIGVEKLTHQCNKYSALFNLEEQDFIGVSYSDMILADKKDMA